MMENKFTPRAEESLRLAQEAAEEMGHGYVGSEHLLLGLMREEEGIAHRVLEEAGLTDDMICDVLHRSVGTGLSGAAPSQGLTPRAKSAVELAVSEASRTGAGYIGTEHLLMGLLREGNNMAIRVLRTVGIDPKKLYSAVVKKINEAPRAAAAAGSGSAAPAREDGKKGGALAEFTRDLTEAARSGKLDPVIGREKEIARVNVEMNDLDKEAGEMLSDRAAQLVAAKNRLEELSNNFDVRKMAARMDENQEDYYILCGWMAEDDVDRFLEEIKDDDKVFVVVEDDHDAYFGEPPTKLENPKLFKPFEMFIQMYGLPAHNEMDPTVFVGLTYSFIFGVMFGDVGQGLLLLIGGALIYHFKKIPLAGIISTAGFFSTIFGFMFGSIFGFEDVLKPLWIRPIDHMTTLPFLGKLNTVSIVAVAFGMFLIIVAMILHIINAAKSKDVEGTWFDANGVAGLVFYLAVVVTIVLFMTGNPLPGGIVMGVMFGVPLLLIFLKEPLARRIEKHADKMETGPGMYVVQGFFEMFETLLSYFSNTISFIRIGAFAVSHAAIMEVVLQLAGAESGHPNWIGVIFGNLFVCGFEGLIVGIQVLRLEYYEMFSRFYSGSGRAFNPYTKKKKNKQA